MNDLDEHQSIASRDWRIQAITTLTDEFHSPWTDQVYEEGTPVYAIGFLRYSEGLLQMPLSNPAAMYLSLALRQLQSSQLVLSEDFFFSLPSARDGIKKVMESTETQFFNALEDLVATIVFSYSAIEAFANESIPTEYTFERKRDDGKCLEVYSREQIERFLSLNIKLDEILTIIFGVPSPKGTAVWQRFMELKKLRDGFVHLKHGDWRNSGPENAEGSIWTRLLTAEVNEFPNIAIDLISHYYPNSSPRWLAKISSA